MSNYDRGRETEYKICDALREAGYIAQRSAGSHSPWDVVALGPTGVRLIQAKRTKKDTFTYEQELDQLRQLPDIPNVSLELWVWRDHKGFVKREVI